MLSFWIKVVRRTALFFLAGLMSVSSFVIPPTMEPQIKNKDTGNFWLPDYGHTLVSSHRAGKGLAPENTMLSVKKALQFATESKIMDMDIQITRDGELVLYHSLFLDENSNAAEYFGRKNTPVFAKTYEQLRGLNMGENYRAPGGIMPYTGLRGEDIPDNLRITKVEDVLDYVEVTAPGEYFYIIEIKYPAPWAPKMIRKLYTMLEERNLCDKTIIGSYWTSVSRYIDRHYAGKLHRSANPWEIVDFYGCYRRGDDLRDEKFRYVALQLPFYHHNGKILLGNMGETAFIDYGHRYGLSMQYWTIHDEPDAKHLYRSGADVIMTNHVDWITAYIQDTELYQEVQSLQN